jgi:hypothetical protein
MIEETCYNCQKTCHKPLLEFWSSGSSGDPVADFYVASSPFIIEIRCFDRCRILASNMHHKQSVSPILSIKIYQLLTLKVMKLTPL